MPSNLTQHAEALKALYDLIYDHPVLEPKDLEYVWHIARHARETGIKKEELSGNKLECFLSVEELNKLAAAGYIGPGKIARPRYRL